MYFKYFPKNNLEKFGHKIYNLLVENFSHTYYVGGMVRDLLLGKNISDIDIATSATPLQVINILQKNRISYTDVNKNFGSIVATHNKFVIEITTLRKDQYFKNRYPKTIFIKSIKQDSKRRDFTINSLYLNTKLNKIFCYNSGILDIKNKIIKFIIKPDLSIKQDPLRIIRALRFLLSLNFKLEKNTKNSIKKNFNLIRTQTKNRIKKELNKITNKKNKTILKDLILGKKDLDNCLQKL